MRDLIGVLAALPPTSGESGSIDEVRDCEDLKSLACARQARATVTFDVGERQCQAVQGVPAGERGKGVGAQVALARRESPNRGGTLVGMARALVTEMPHTLAALEAGQLNEWRSMLLVRETACLSASDRCAVDPELSADTGTFEGVGNRRIVAAAKAAAYRRDPRSVAHRASHAAKDRYVSLRPAPDTMTYLTALLPVTEGVAVHAELTRHADALRAAGDQRTRGQLMADTLVECTTGTPGGVSRVEVQLIMTDRTLFQGDSEPARLPGYGIVPAEWARTLLGGRPAPRPAEQPSRQTIQPTIQPSRQTVEPAIQPTIQPSRQASRQTVEPAIQPIVRPTGESGTVTTDAAGTAGPTGAAMGSGSGPRPPTDCPEESRQEFEVWLRRLYTAPGSGELVAADSRARLFTPGQRRFLNARDDVCRTPYCDAPIRHYDHIVPWQDSGPTSLSNGAGLCEACNHTKELPGWNVTPSPDPELLPDTSPDPAGRHARHAIEVRTPTGRTYRSTAPPLPGSHHGNRERQGAGTVRPSGSTGRVQNHRGARMRPPARYSRGVDLVFA